MNRILTDRSTKNVEHEIDPTKLVKIKIEEIERLPELIKDAKEVLSRQTSPRQTSPKPDESKNTSEPSAPSTPPGAPGREDNVLAADTSKNIHKNGQNDGSLAHKSVIIESREKLRDNQGWSRISEAEVLKMAHTTWAWSWLHYQSFKTYKDMDEKITVLIVIISACLAVPQISNAQNQGILRIFTIIMSVIIAMLSGYKQVVNYAGRAQQHRESANQFNRIYQSLAHELTLYRKDRQSANEFIDGKSQIIDIYMTSAPDISPAVIKKFKEKFPNIQLPDLISESIHGMVLEIPDETGGRVNSPASTQPGISFVTSSEYIQPNHSSPNQGAAKTLKDLEKQFNLSKEKVTPTNSGPASYMQALMGTPTPTPVELHPINRNNEPFKKAFTENNKHNNEPFKKAFTENNKHNNLRDGHHNSRHDSTEPRFPTTPISNIGNNTEDTDEFASKVTLSDDPPHIRHIIHPDNIRVNNYNCVDEIEHSDDDYSQHAVSFSPRKKSSNVLNKTSFELARLHSL